MSKNSDSNRDQYGNFITGTTRCACGEMIYRNSKLQLWASDDTGIRCEPLVLHSPDSTFQAVKATQTGESEWLVESDCVGVIGTYAADTAEAAEHDAWGDLL